MDRLNRRFDTTKIPCHPPTLSFTQHLGSREGPTRSCVGRLPTSQRFGNRRNKLMEHGLGVVVHTQLGRCNKMGLRVFMVEDSAPMREAISRIIAEECDIVGYADDGRDALQKAKAHQPEVILLDISLPNVNGMTLLPLLRAALPEAAIVMLSNHDREEYIAEAHSRGADAYICKSDAHQALLPAIHRGRAAALAQASPLRSGSLARAQALLRG